MEDENLFFEIGKIAGQIWEYLKENKQASTFKLKTALFIDNSKLFLAIGWLLREEKISITKLEKGYNVSFLK